jgi:protein TonB
VPTPQAATPETLTAVPPAVPPAPLPQLALPAIPPPPPGPGPAPEAEAPLPLPPAEPEAAPRHTAARPTPRPPSRHRPESHVEARAEDRPAAAAPPSETAPAAAAPAAPPGPVTPPRAVAGLAGNRRPVYPTQARDRGEEGTVLVLVQVTAQGAAASVSVARSSGHPALDEAALTAIRSWKFSPATRGGVPVAAEAEVPVAFHLND